MSSKRLLKLRRRRRAKRAQIRMFMESIQELSSRADVVTISMHNLVAGMNALVCGAMGIPKGFMQGRSTSCNTWLQARMMDDRFKDNWNANAGGTQE